MLKKPIGEVLRVNASISFWLVLAGGVIAILISYFSAPAYQSHIKFVTILLAGAAAIYTSYYVGAALHLNIYRDKQKASFEILKLLNLPEFVEVRHFIDHNVEGHTEVSAVALHKKIKDDVKLDDSVTIVLGILEDASIAIQQGYVDEDILYISIIDIVQRNARSLRGYIDVQRTVKKQPLYFRELDKLNIAWSNGLHLSDGKPFPSLDNG